MAPLLPGSGALLSQLAAGVDEAAALDFSAQAEYFRQPTPANRQRAIAAGRNLRAVRAAAWDNFTGQLAQHQETP